MTVNPYAPPGDPLPETTLPAGPPASRWHRIWAKGFDLAIVPFVAMVILQSLPWGNMLDAMPRNLAAFVTDQMKREFGVLFLIIVGLWVAVQWTLLGLRGQTLGKLIAGIRVVRLDGSRAGVVRALVLRSWPMLAAGLLIRDTLLVLIIDAVFVFRGNRRCLHDLIAGTKVVEVVRIVRVRNPRL